MFLNISLFSPQAFTDICLLACLYTTAQTFLIKNKDEVQRSRPSNVQKAAV